MPEQYYDMTVGEILRQYLGYELREVKKWERSRFIAWMGALPYDTKKRLREPYDIMKLPTDPTDEERRIMQEERLVEMKEAARAMLLHYRSMGYNV